VDCPECTVDSSAVRHEPDVRLSFGDPVRTESGVDVPVSLEGANRLGGARLALRYPIDRFQSGTVEFPAAMSGWLHLTDARDGEVVVGLIQTANPETQGDRAAQRIDMTVHLTLKPGMEPGGEITAADGQFSGPDGVRLEVDMGQPSRRLFEPIQIDLSENHPDPFSSGTNFSVTLAQPADIEVGVYDLSGRQVVALFHGRLAAGVHPFGWDGRMADGAAAPNGIYFYRAVSRETTTSRKMILLRKN